jgi:hypothetical protein
MTSDRPFVTPDRPETLPNYESHGLVYSTVDDNELSSEDKGT